MKTQLLSKELLTIVFIFFISFSYGQKLARIDSLIPVGGDDEELPDLTISSFSSSVSSIANIMNVSCTVANVGEGDAAATSLSYYRSTDRTCDIATDVLISSSAVSALEAGESISFSKKLLLDATSSAPYVLLCVDPSDDIEESDETNNMQFTGAIVSSIVSEVVHTQIFPNPATKFIHLQLLTSEAEEVNSYELYDLGGRLIKQGSINLHVIDVSALKKGSYLLRVKGGSVDETQRLSIN